MIRDHTPVRRVPTYDDLPDEALRCAVAGRHLGFLHNDPTVELSTDWGRLNAAIVHYRCECGRWKQETVDLDTGEQLSRGADYGGGVLLAVGGTLSQRDAKVVWLARVRQRAALAAKGSVTRLRKKGGA